jgi:hypothetical protein
MTHPEVLATLESIRPIARKRIEDEIQTALFVH